MTKFKVLAWHVPRWNEENNEETLVRIAGIRAEI
jgi:hypothetical protein